MRHFKLVQVQRVPPHRVLLEFDRATEVSAVGYAEKEASFRNLNGELELWETVDQKDHLISRVVPKRKNR